MRGSNWLGDVVMTIPAFCRLREAYPEAHIAVLTLPKLADIYRYLPAIDSVLTLTREESMLSVAARLRVERFDTGLILPASARTVLPFWLAGIPQRIGYAGSGRTLLLTHPVQRSEGAQKIRRRPYAEIRRLTASPASQDINSSDTFLQSSAAQNSSSLITSLHTTSLHKFGLRFARSHARHISSLSHSPLSNHSALPLHHLHHYLHLVKALGAQATPSAPSLTVPDADVQALRERFSLPSPNEGQPLFGLNPGAEYGLAKRWPEERFVAAAIEMVRRSGCRWIVLGGAADRELAARITAAIQSAITSMDKNSAGNKSGNIPGTMDNVPRQMVWNLAGETSLRELCAALRVCDIVLTNDTGPMHVAAAVGTPIVVPFGSTSPELTGPGLPGETRHHLLKSSADCAPCFQRVCPIDFRCMNSITVSHVVEAMTQQWEILLSLR